MSRIEQDRKEARKITIEDKERIYEVRLMIVQRLKDSRREMAKKEKKERDRF